MVLALTLLFPNSRVHRLAEGTHFGSDTQMIPTVSNQIILNHDDFLSDLQKIK